MLSKALLADKPNPMREKELNVKNKAIMELLLTFINNIGLITSTSMCTKMCTYYFGLISK